MSDLHKPQGSKSPVNGVGARGGGISVARSNSLRSHSPPRMRRNQMENQVNVSICDYFIF